MAEIIRFGHCYTINVLFPYSGLKWMVLFLYGRLLGSNCLDSNQIRFISSFVATSFAPSLNKGNFWTYATRFLLNSHQRRNKIDIEIQHFRSRKVKQNEQKNNNIYWFSLELVCTLFWHSLWNIRLQLNEASSAGQCALSFVKIFKFRPDLPDNKRTCLSSSSKSRMWICTSQPGVEFAEYVRSHKFMETWDFVCELWQPSRRNW